MLTLVLTAANVVFVESPVAVGFSYSSDNSDYASFSDSQTGNHYISSYPTLHQLVITTCWDMKSKELVTL